MCGRSCREPHLAHDRVLYHSQQGLGREEVSFRKNRRFPLEGPCAGGVVLGAGFCSARRSKALQRCPGRCALARQAWAFVTFVAAFQGFLLFPSAQLFEHALGLVRLLDVAVPLFRKILGLLLPLLPMGVRELLRRPEAVKLGRLLEG